MSSTQVNAKQNKNLKRTGGYEVQMRHNGLSSQSGHYKKSDILQQNPTDGIPKLPGRNELEALKNKQVDDNALDAIGSRVSLLPDSTNDVLSYYQRKVESLADDYGLVQRRLDQIADAMDNQDNLTNELLQREAEISELQRMLSDTQVCLFQERERVLRLYAENDRLKIREMDDRRKIQYLLQLSGLGPAEVTYFLRDSTAVIPADGAGDFAETATGECDRQSQANCVSGLVVTPFVPEQGVIEFTASGKIIKRFPTHGSTAGQREAHEDVSSSLHNVSRSEHEAALREVEMTKAALRALRAQLAEQTRNARDQIDALMDDRQVMQETMDTLRKRYEERLHSSEERLKCCRILLYDNAKDFLAQRTQFRQAEKAWISERDRLSSRLETGNLTNTAVTNRTDTHDHSDSGVSRQFHSTFCRSDLLPKTGEDRSNPFTQTREEHLKQTLLNLEQQLNQQQNLSDMYREQVIQLEEELVHCREEGAVSKDVLKNRSNKLNERLQMVTRRCHDLERRRQLEMQGYRADIGALRKKLRDIEKQLLKVAVGFTDDMQLGDIDLAILKRVKTSTRKSVQILSELKSLKLKMYTLEDELRKI